jgi:RNA polymerase sigma factor (sigma-70 family)
MADARTEALRRLLDANDPSVREADWAEFVQGYSRLILHVARSICGEHDGAMDQYAYVLEQLRAEDFRRLRTFVADGRSEFSTWLLVVAQRICLDHHRRRYGRVRNNGNGSIADEDDAMVRRRLADMVGADIDLDSLADGNGVDAEYAIRVEQLYDALNLSLSRLPPRDRLLVKLRFEDDCSIPEIATALDVPSRFHVYRRLAQVLASLKTTLVRNGVSESAP